MKAIRVGLAGIGTVGSGLWRVLARNADEIARRAGRPIEIVIVADRNEARARAIIGEEALARGVRVVADARVLAADPEIDIVVELIGGYTVAKEVVLAAIAAGKHVVTANKALLAVHGEEIFAAAQAKGVMVAFEAAVAGGIPIIKALREGLAGNRIEWVAGIINGTTNFILTQMEQQGLSFAEALAQAQSFGYAEADPTFDIEGIDAGHKATLLASLAFGVPIQFNRAHIEGITRIDRSDVAFADSLGYRIKLLGIAKRREEGFELRVHPTLIPKDHLLASVAGAMNAVLVKGDAVGQTLYYGPGAGSEPTASAVIADLVDVTRLHTADPEHRVPHLAFQPQEVQPLVALPISKCRSAFYLRLKVVDRPGVLAEIAQELAKEEVSIAALVQRAPQEGAAQLVLLTHECEEQAIDAVIAAIAPRPFLLDPVVKLRVEHLA